jgi:hypothetical protein
MKQIFTTLFIFSLLTSLFTLQSHAATPPAPVPQTGQTLCYDATGFTIVCAGTGQDGDIKAGVASPTLASFQCMSHGNSCCYGLLLSVYISSHLGKHLLSRKAG